MHEESVRAMSRRIVKERNPDVSDELLDEVTAEIDEARLIWSAKSAAQREAESEANWIECKLLSHASASVTAGRALEKALCAESKTDSAGRPLLISRTQTLRTGRLALIVGAIALVCAAAGVVLGEWLVGFMN